MLFEGHLTAISNILCDLSTNTTIISLNTVVAKCIEGNCHGICHIVIVVFLAKCI